MKLSVCVVTYNQAPYIGGCLDSILRESIPGSWEVLVADDASTDGTGAIAESFASASGGRLRVIRNHRNVGPFANYRAVHLAARGVYVAHIDADDLVLPGKLSRQIAILDEQQSVALVAHRMVVERNGVKVGVTSANPAIIDAKRLLMAHPTFIQSSVMYRKDLIRPLFESGADFIDFEVYAYAATRGSIAFIDDVLGVYRAGVGISRHRRLMPHIQRAIDRLEGVVDAEVIAAARARQYLRYALAAVEEGEEDEFVRFILPAYEAASPSMLVRLIYMLRRYPSGVRYGVMAGRRGVALFRRLRERALQKGE